MADTAVTPSPEPVKPPLSGPPQPAPPGHKRYVKTMEDETPFPKFLELLDSITDDDWPSYILYVWRMDPFTDNTNGGLDVKYIGRHNSKVTEEMLTTQYGSGAYKLSLNKGPHWVAGSRIAIEHHKHPPHIPPGDWLNHPKNKKWQAWKPAIERWWAEENKPPAVYSNNGDVPAWAVTFMNDVRQQLASRQDLNGSQKELLVGQLVQTLPQLLEARDPVKALAGLKEFFPAPTPAPPPDTTIQQFLLSEIKAIRESHQSEVHSLRTMVDTLTTRLLDMKIEQTKPPDPINQVKAVGELVSSVTSLAAGITNPAEPKPVWAEIVENTVPKVLELGDRWLTSRAMRMRPNPGVQPVVTQPTTAVTTTAPQSVTAPSANPPADQPQAPIDMDIVQRTLLTNLAEKTAAALSLGMDGRHFADQLFRLYGEVQFDAFIGAVPQDQLLPLLKQIPEAMQMLTPFEPLLPQFISDIYAWNLESEDEEPEPPPPEPEPKPRAKKKGAKK